MTRRDRPLCCCEYYDRNGERQSVANCCCNCPSLDEACDRCIRCQKVDDSILRTIYEVADDRCRCPTLTSRGAVKLRLDIVFPPCAMALSFLLSQIDSSVPLVIVFLTPTILFLTDRLFCGRSRSADTRAWADTARRPISNMFWFSFSFFFALTSHLLFLIFVSATREVLLWEILTGNTAFFVCVYLAYATRNAIGRKLNLNQRHSTHMGSSSPNCVSDGGANAPLAVSEPEVCKICMMSFSKFRSTHCLTCNSCVALQDQHCRWLNCCVGAVNHRHFIALLVMLIWCTLYEAHLGLTAICTPEIYFDTFLLPSDCRFIYNDPSYAVIFQNSVYLIAAGTFLTLLLLKQVVLISQNVTAHELSVAKLDGRVFCGLLVRNNPHSQGLLRNWTSFLRGTRLNSKATSVSNTV